jgi:hypothetical protein
MTDTVAITPIAAGTTMDNLVILPLQPVFIWVMTIMLLLEQEL